MSNAAKDEVLSTFGETINNSLVEMDDRKLHSKFLAKHLLTPFFSFVASYATAPEKCSSLPEQSVTLVPSTPLACMFTSLSYMTTD